MMHLMKLLVALALAAAPSARGMAPYATDSTEREERVQALEGRVQDGCGDTCADVVTTRAPRVPPPPKALDDAFLERRSIKLPISR